MHSERQYGNLPIWCQNQRLNNSNGANFFFDPTRFPVNSNMQGFLVPNAALLQPNFINHPSRWQFNSPPARPSSFKHADSRKRGNSDSVDTRGPNNKRTCLNNGTSQDNNSQTNIVSPSSEKFVVPINRGTEEITMSIWDYFLSSQMTPEDLRRKLLLRSSLLTILKDAFPKCRLFIVGSSMTGFATRTSDVDMCFLISDEEVHQKREAPMVLVAIAKALRLCSFVHAPQVIRAKVPILKFSDKISGVECDLNINNTIGVRNTHLLRYYAFMDWRVRPLLLFIKHWARFHDINDASKKTISSYSLSLMLIHFLQVGVQPPVLPCLQKMKPDLFSNTRDVRSLSLCMEKIDFTSRNTATLGELFLGFLHYYSDVFRYDSDLISIRTGKRLKKYDADGDPSQWKHLCIEEPFEGSNTARSVFDAYVFQRIRRVFSASFQRLGQHRNCQAILSHPF